MRNYDGKRIEYEDIENRFQQVDKYKLSPDFIERMKESWDNYNLSENDYNRIENRIIRNIKHPFVSGSKRAMLVFLTIFVILPIVLFLLKITNMFLIGTGIVIVVFVGVWVSDVNFKKIESNKLNALKNNKYTAYAFNMPEKLWCVLHIKDGHEEQDHAIVDNEGYLYDFFIDCEGFAFSMEEYEYQAVIDKLIVVLFFFDKRTVLEILVQ